MATYPPHPLYKQLPVIPGDHAYNIATQAIALVLDWPEDQLAQLAEGRLAGCTVSVKADDLKALFDQVSDEMRIDVLKHLTQPGHEPEHYLLPEPIEQQAPTGSIYGTNPNFW
jgi:hypothetical protein